VDVNTSGLDFTYPFFGFEPGSLNECCLRRAVLIALTGDRGRLWSDFECLNHEDPCWVVLTAPHSCLTLDMLKGEEIRLSDPVRGRENYAQCHVFETSDLQDQTTWTAVFIEPF
jgi:hypothetical protein